MEVFMPDLAMIVLMGVLFAAAIGFAHACERI